MTIPNSEASKDLLNKRSRISEPYIWDDEIEQAVGRAFDWRCPFCNKDISDGDYYLAHINPVGSGVGVVPGNIVLSCLYCNQHMHERHAQKYCMDNSIPFWEIQFKLEIISKFFSDKTVKQSVKAPNATAAAIAYFQEDMTRLQAPASQAVAALKGYAGKSTVYQVYERMKNESQTQDGTPNSDNLLG